MTDTHATPDRVRRPWLKFGPVQITLPHMTRWVTIIPRIEIGKDTRS